jgi:hypothetical protein
MELRDRQIQAWLKQSLASLIESYENQAEIFSTRAQRSHGPVAEASGEVDGGDLAEDLQELRQVETAPSETASFAAHRIGHEDLPPVTSRSSPCSEHNC